MKVSGAVVSRPYTELSATLALDQSFTLCAADHEHYVRSNEAVFSLPLQRTHSVTPFATECNYVIDIVQAGHEAFLGNEQSTNRALRQLRTDYEAAIKDKKLNKATQQCIKDFVALEQTLLNLRKLYREHRHVFYSWFEAYQHDPTAFTLHLHSERDHETGEYQVAYYQIQDPNGKPIGNIDAEITLIDNHYQTFRWFISDTCEGYGLLPTQVQAEAYTYPQSALCAYLYAFRRYTLPDRWVMDNEPHLVD